MEKQTFHILIDAPREKVWDILWGQQTYPAWTSVFTPGSRVETDWQEGSQVLFLDAKNEGMVATITENRPNEFMSFKHTGTIMNGAKDTPQEWPGSYETYSLRSEQGKTHLTVEMDVTDEYKDYFLKTWPQALEKVKELAEARSAEKQA